MYPEEQQPDYDIDRFPEIELLREQGREARQFERQEALNLEHEQAVQETAAEAMRRAAEVARQARLQQAQDLAEAKAALAHEIEREQQSRHVSRQEQEQGESQPVEDADEVEIARQNALRLARGRDADDEGWEMANEEEEDSDDEGRAQADYDASLLARLQNQGVLNANLEEVPSNDDDGEAQDDYDAQLLATLQSQGVLNANLEEVPPNDDGSREESEEYEDPDASNPFRDMDDATYLRHRGLGEDGLPLETVEHANARRAADRAHLADMGLLEDEYPADDDEDDLVEPVLAPEQDELFDIFEDQGAPQGGNPRTFRDSEEYDDLQEDNQGRTTPF